MQNCHHQLSKHWSIVAVLLLTPLWLWGTIPILPTFDDWTSLTSPSFEPLFTKEHFLFFGYHWRPFDAIIGYLLGLNPQQLFPTLNHCLIVSGHLGCSLLLYQLLGMLSFNNASRNIATLFFFVTPATMATVMSVDGINQVYALFWGMAAFLVYVKLEKGKYLVWFALIILATLCKENGLMWALICPILAYGFRFIKHDQLKKDLLIGLCIMAVYALAIMLLPKDIEIHPEYIPNGLKAGKSFMKFLLTSFVTVDYVWLLYQPERNLWLAAMTLLLSLPFMYSIFISHRQLFNERKMMSICISLFIAVAPHILTSYSMMHTYAGMPMIALMIAVGIDAYGRHLTTVIVSCLLLLVSIVVIDIHLWRESLASGLIGKSMAVETVKKTGKPVKRVYLINIDEEYSKLSSFCVLPYDAFGWGLAVRHETDYQWPESIKDTLISRTPDARKTARQLGLDIIKTNEYDCVWITDHQHIDVIKR
ncbi:MAG: hypothetical protein IJ144_00650 [Prevotella sp.]|nr:hypothetical protein [Prevotella sp.]